MLTSSLGSVLFALLLGILIIIILSTRYKMHPFFSLSIACIITGLLGGLSFTEILLTMKEGFGKIMSSLAFIIVIGTALGMTLQASGATFVMSETILKFVGARRSVLATSVTGFVVGVPIFCDSGYIVLNGLNKSMIKRTGIAAIIMSTALATGLYAIHCMIPPHPGATSAAGTINASYGIVILYGIIVAFPAMLAGYFWAVFYGKKMNEPKNETTDKDDVELNEKLPGIFASFLPVVLPILLIALRAVFASESSPVSNNFLNKFLVIGDPSIALTIGLILALLIIKNKQKAGLQSLMTTAIEKAGGILIIIGAGAAFGAIINALKIHELISNTDFLSTLGLLYPFLIAFILKTAQGSSTVAVLTAASIVLPFLPVLNLDTENGRVLAVLAMGAGSMGVSHVNDSYFWVIANFSKLKLKPMLKVFTVATFWMSVVAMLFVYLLSLILL